MLLWSFALVFGGCAFLLGELALRLAARRLDRLVAD
jgi:hypothetical protein